MDITTITTAYEGLKVGKTLLKAVYDSKVEADSKEKINEVMSKLGEAQDTLFTMREELFRLQSDNKELKDKYSEIENWLKKSEQYTLTKTTGGAVVYKFNDEPEHFACPSCIEKKTIQILQDNRTMSGKYRCVGCESEYPINPRTKQPPIKMPSPYRR